MSAHFKGAFRSRGRALPQSIDILIALGTAILVATALAQATVAEESYICEDGRVVTVRFGELEKLSRTDTCIAKYLAARGAAAVPATLTPRPAAEAPAGIEAAHVPLPVRKPHIDLATRTALDNAGVVASQQVGTEIIVHHEPPPATAAGENAGLLPRVETVTFRRAAHHFYSSEELPKGPVDFRHVPIINAAPGEAAVFVHTR